MSEGPQVKLRTEWLARWLDGRRIHVCQVGRDDLVEGAGHIQGRHFVSGFCKGKHIFLEFEGGRYLHNHLLMRGKWRKMEGQLLFLPPGIQLALYVGPYTVCNVNGQVLEWLDREGVDEVLSRLGPDILHEPYPEEDILEALRQSDLPVAEAILDQSVISGIGNVARSEALFLAGLHPELPSGSLSDQQYRALSKAMLKVMKDSYESGGRWYHRVYQCSGHRCGVCGTRIKSVMLAPGRRRTYFCPSCQSA